MRTNVRPAAGSFEFYNDLTTARAWLSFAAKHAGKIHVTAPLSFGVNIIFIRAAALFDGKVHNGAQLGIEFSKLFRRDRAY